MDEILHRPTLAVMHSGNIEFGVTEGLLLHRVSDVGVRTSHGACQGVCKILSINRLDAFCLSTPGGLS